MGFSAVKILFPCTPQPGFARSCWGEPRTELRCSPGQIPGPQGSGSQDHLPPPRPASMAAWAEGTSSACPAPGGHGSISPDLRSAARLCTVSALHSESQGPRAWLRPGPQSCLTLYSPSGRFLLPAVTVCRGHDPPEPKRDEYARATLSPFQGCPKRRVSRSPGRAG